MKDVSMAVDFERLQLVDFIEFQEGSMKAQRKVLASCLTDDKGDFMTDEAAMEYMDTLSMAEFFAMAEQFAEAMKVPLASKTRS